MSTAASSAEPSQRLLVDTFGAAGLLSLSPRTIASLAKAGRLPIVRIGKCIRFAVSDLNEFVEYQKASGHNDGITATCQPS
jgi:excisionase family DNA binding protein